MVEMWSNFQSIRFVFEDLGKERVVTHTDVRNFPAVGDALLLPR